MLPQKRSPAILAGPNGHPATFEDCLDAIAQLPSGELPRLWRGLERLPRRLRAGFVVLPQRIFRLLLDCQRDAIDLLGQACTVATEEGRKAWQFTSKPADPEGEEQLLALADAGWSYTRIGQEYGLSREAARSAVRRARRRRQQQKKGVVASKRPLPPTPAPPQHRDSENAGRKEA